MTIASLRARFSVLLPSGSLRARLAHGAFWTLMGSASGQALAAAAAIVMARVLGTTLYGELGMVQSTLAMFGVFAGLMLGQMLGKHVAEYRATNLPRAGRVLAMGLLVATVTGAAVSLAVAVGADVLATRVLGAAHMRRYILLGAPLLLMGALTGVQGGALAGFEAFRVSSTWGVVTAALTALACVAGAALRGVEGAVYGNLLGSAVGLAVCQCLLARECRRHGVRIDWRRGWEERDLLWRFALPSMLTADMVAPVSWGANALLVNTPGGYAQLGVFNAANQWRTFLLFIPSVIVGPFLPIMCQLWATGQVHRLKALLIKTLYGNVVIVGALAMGLALASKYVMKLYGAGFEGAVPTLRSVLVVAVLVSAGTVVGNLLISTGAMWLAFAINALWGVLLLASAAVLTPRYGAFGLALSYVIAYAVHTAAQLAYSWHRCRRLQAPVPPAYDRPRGFDVVGLVGPDVDAAPAGNLQPAAAPILVPVPTSATPDSADTNATSRSDE